MRNKGKVIQWVIYDHPRDFPENWVVRSYEITAQSIRPAKFVQLFDSLAEARAALPTGLYNFGRSSVDPPVIVEVWI